MAAVYTILDNDRTDGGKKLITAQIAYTSESYSSGLAVDGPSLGCRNAVLSLSVIDAPGFAPSFNGGKIRLYQQGAGAGALTEVSGSQTVTLKVIAIGF